MDINEIVLASVGSTNTYAREKASELPLPSLIIANEQTAGRGRRGNSFYSPADTGLYMSLLFEAAPDFDLITPAAAVCVCGALDEIGVNAGIKWVNDVYIEGKKVCGILTERFSSGGRELTCCGIGINLTTALFPGNLPNAGSVGVNADKTALAENIARRLMRMNERFNKSEILKEYRAKSIVTGKEVSFCQNGRELAGVAESIADDCSLIVKTNSGEEFTLSSGEISVKLR